MKYICLGYADPQKFAKKEDINRPERAPFPAPAVLLLA
jgi:hypothetical protein